MVLDGSQTTESFGKLVAVLDGKIKRILPNDLVDLLYRFDNDGFVDHPHSRGLPIKDFKAKNVPYRTGGGVKIGLYNNHKGKLTFVEVLHPNELGSYKEPQTEIEKLQQKLALYRFITGNAYNI